MEKEMLLLTSRFHLEQSGGWNYCLWKDRTLLITRPALEV